MTIAMLLQNTLVSAQRTVG